MIQSESIAKLTEAKVAAQAEIQHAIKDSKNEHFKSKYADLANVLDATRIYAKHGIAITQSPELGRVDGLWIVSVTTKLAHISGEWESGVASTPLSKADAQGVGSAITYMRRYSLAAFCGIAQDDDDAESAVGRGGAGKGGTKPLKQVDKRIEALEAAEPSVDAAKISLKAGAANGSLDRVARDLATNYPDLWLKVKGFASELKK